MRLVRGLSLAGALLVSVLVTAGAASVAQAAHAGGRTQDMPASPTATPAGDQYENNYRVEDAPRLAWGVAYDLSLGCPDPAPGACISGDHDFFRVAVKRGVPFVALTYDLGPTADTTLAIYRPSPGSTDPSTGIAGWQLVQGNDDAERGVTLRSQVLISPTWDGDALLIVAASDRVDPPDLPGATGVAGRYSLIVGSPFLPALQQVLQAQQDPGSTHSDLSAPAPMATATPTADRGVVIPPLEPGASDDPEEILREACLTGAARVVNPEGARFSAAAAPAQASRLLMVYPAGAGVQLLGSCYLGWVKALPERAVSPGWMYAPDLELALAPEGAAVIPTVSAEVDLGGDPTVRVDPTEIAPTPGPLRIEALPTAPAIATTAAPRDAISILVDVRTQAQRPRSGVRVQLADLYGQVLREGPTDEQGRIALVADVAAGSAIWIQIPAIGLTTRVDRSSPSVTVVLP